MNYSIRLSILRILSLAALIMIPSIYMAADTSGNLPKRKFIAHRGVDLKHTIAGENSLEAIWLAKRAGFDAIETDVRLTKDDSIVVMHDPGLNRTCLNADGSDINKTVEIKDLTWSELQNSYKLRADDPKNQSKIPSLHTYLNECKKAGIFVFIEPKLVDSTGVHYKRIIRMADDIFGKGNYVVTSNNRANNIIRNVNHDKSTPLMGILYQSTYPEVKGLGNIIMAISATRIKPDEYAMYHLKAHEDGLLSESHADKFQHFDMINQSPVDWVSTDMLVPDYHGQGRKVKTGSHSDFGGLYLTFDLKGETEVKLGKQKFKATSIDGTRQIRHQVALYNETPEFEVKPIGDSEVSNVEFLQVEF